ncbi:MAG: oligosaccharide flippase family protein [Bacteroidota bacterium]
MGIVIKQSLISSTIAYAGVILGAVNTLFILPAYLSFEQIGLYRAIIAISTISFPFALVGLSSITLKYIPRYKENEELKHRFFQFLLFLLVPAFLIFLVLFKVAREPLFGFMAKESPEVARYDFLIIVLVFINASTTLFDSFTRIHLNIVVVNIAREVVIKLMTGILVLLYAVDLLTFDQLLNSLILNYSAALILLALYSVNKGHYKPSLKPFLIPVDFWKSIMPFGLISMLGSFSALIVSNVDILMVSAMLGLDKNGIYSTVMYMAIVIEIPRRILTQIASPLVSHAFEKNDLKEVNNIYKKTSLNLLIGGALFYLGIILNLDGILRLLPSGESLSAGKYVVILLGLGKLIDMGAGVNGEIVVLSKYYKFNLVSIAVLAACTIGFNLLFIPVFDMNGAAIATLVSLFLFNLSKFTFLFVKFKMQPFNLNTLKVIFITLAVYFIGSWLPVIEIAILDIILKSLFVLLIFGILIYWSKASEDVNQVIEKGLLKLKSYF